jgi:hypothetical protein
LIGKSHLPHAKFIDFGTHSLTIEGLPPSKKSQTGKEGVTVNALIGLMERFIRIYD